MTEDHVLKLLMLVIDKATKSARGDQKRAFREIEGLVASMQDDVGSCSGPFTDEFPKRQERYSDDRGLWRAYGCDNHVHIFNLAFGCIVVGRELATKILALGSLP